MRDLSEIKVRAPRNLAEAARWIGLTLACLVIAYFAIAVLLVVIGVWGGE